LNDEAIRFVPFALLIHFLDLILIRGNIHEVHICIYYDKVE
jgi:hypothetical protein